MSARTDILTRLRATPPPFADSDAKPDRLPATHIDDDEDLAARFIAEVERVKGMVHAAESDAQAKQILRALLIQKSVKRATCWDGEYIPLDGVAAMLSDLDITRVAGDNAQVATADVGITGVDWAIAATGTLVLSSGQGRSRMASLLPPVHIAIVTTDQLVPRLEDYIAAQRADKLSVFRTSSNITLITGCSRTSDIEMQPVFGVHGPLELHIVLIENLA
jgi:L-lactate dehydrogenase complex protein LldG